MAVDKALPREPTAPPRSGFVGTFLLAGCLMMGSCAFLMPVASYRFVRSGKYDPRAALGLTLFGLPGVAVAAWIVKELPLGYVNWLVVIVVIYTAVSMLYAASKIETPISTGQTGA